MKPHLRTVLVVGAFLCAVACGTAVNFLAKRAAQGEPPIALNGWRTLTAVAIVLLPALWLRVPLRLSFSEFWRYALLAALTMAVPHALIFLGLRRLGVTETTVAFVEAAVLGVVIVYLLTRGRRVSAASVFCAALALVGLAVFLGVGPGTFPVSAGDGCIFAAAVATAFGMILAENEKLKPRPRANGAGAVPAPERKVEGLRGNLSQSLRKTLVSCTLAGSGTLLAVAGMNLALGQGGPPVPVPVPGSWPWIVLLAFVGSCLTWFSLFLLIELKQLILAAAVVAAIPVATELANHFWFTPGVTTPQQWVGGTAVLASLAGLIRAQLVR